VVAYTYWLVHTARPVTTSPSTPSADGFALTRPVMTPCVSSSYGGTAGSSLHCSPNGMSIAVSFIMIHFGSLFALMVIVFLANARLCSVEGSARNFSYVR